MIVIGVVMAIALFGAYVFLGFKISESIVNPDIRTFFWGLYFVTLITLFNIVLSVYFYVSVSDKTGPIGPMGRKGKQGPRGDAGVCSYNADDTNCKVKTVRLLIEKAVEDLAGIPMSAKGRDLICGFLNAPSVITGKTNKEIIKESRFNFTDLKNLKTYLGNIGEADKTHATQIINGEPTGPEITANKFIGRTPINNAITGGSLNGSELKGLNAVPTATC